MRMSRRIRAKPSRSADCTTYGLSTLVIRADTHEAAMFRVGSDAYKIKRAIRFPFMAFSTVKKRRAACEAETTANCRMRLIFISARLQSLAVRRDCPWW